MVKPRLGKARVSGVCPPSKPDLSLLLPLRAPWPLWPLPEVPPRPEPMPRPMRLRCREGGGGLAREGDEEDGGEEGRRERGTHVRGRARVGCEVAEVGRL